MVVVVGNFHPIRSLANYFSSQFASFTYSSFRRSLVSFVEAISMFETVFVAIPISLFLLSLFICVNALAFFFFFSCLKT